MAQVGVPIILVPAHSASNAMQVQAMQSMQPMNTLQTIQAIQPSQQLVAFDSSSLVPVGSQSIYPKNKP